MTAQLVSNDLIINIMRNINKNGQVSNIYITWV